MFLPPAIFYREQSLTESIQEKVNYTFNKRVRFSLLLDFYKNHKWASNKGNYLNRMKG